MVHEGAAVPGSLSRPSRCRDAARLRGGGDGRSQAEERAARPARRLHRRRERRPARRDPALGVDRQSSKVARAAGGARQAGARPRRGDPQRPSGRARCAQGRRPRAEASTARPRRSARPRRRRTGNERLPPVQRRGRPQGGVRAGRGQPTRRSPSWSTSARPSRARTSSRSRSPRTRADARRQQPAVLYLGAQHAREWITPEMIRRLMHHFVDGYAERPGDPQARRRQRAVVRAGRQPRRLRLHVRAGQRLWRKNLRDNNGDGEITADDGVDLNRNFADKWGYDNEGSSPDPASETYRGTAPASEPETRRSTARRGASASSSSSTTTRPPSCCSTAPAGRSPRRRPTTSSTRRWPATTPTRRCPATTPTSRPSSTRPTATPTRT